MNEDQIKAYNEMGQLIMDKTGCTSEEAAKQINDLAQEMLASLNKGILS